MHVEFLVEDASGKIMLGHLVRKIFPEDWTCRITCYRGVGTIPKKDSSSDPKVIVARTLLDNLPRLLEGFGNAYAGQDESIAVVVVCDLDRKDLTAFSAQLQQLLTLAPHHLRHTYFRLAIEEGEAWLLGDRSALLTAYPRAKKAVLNRYRQDAVCGTWEVLADAVYPGGHRELEKKNYQAIGAAKCEWANRITPWCVPANNRSPSFGRFANLFVGLASGKSCPVVA